MWNSGRLPLHYYPDEGGVVVGWLRGLPLSSHHLSSHIPTLEFERNYEVAVPTLEFERKLSSSCSEVQFNQTNVNFIVEFLLEQVRLFRVNTTSIQTLSRLNS